MYGLVYNEINFDYQENYDRTRLKVLFKTIHPPTIYCPFKIFHMMMIQDIPKLWYTWWAKYIDTEPGFRPETYNVTLF